ncbi:ABC transporter permease [Streptomyces sp. NPDC003362]
MTAVTTTTAPERARAARGPRGLTWVLLRVHRSALWFWLMLLAVAGGALLWAYGPGVNAALDVYRGMDCGPGYCDATVPAAQHYQLATVLGTGLLTLTPLLTAAWAGGALIGRELENGTARLAWTQSVTPARWLAAKLAVPAALLAAGTVLLTLLHRLLWSVDGPLREATGTRDWHDGGVYLANGTLATAYALLGLAVGALAGLLLRRALPALAAAVVSLLVLTGALSSLRPHLWPAVTLTGKEYYPEWTGMVVGDGALTSTGARVPDPICVDDARCLAEHDIVGFYRDHHPAGHFWPLQLVETGIVLAVAALAVLAAFWLLNRRTGARRTGARRTETRRPGAAV